MKSYHVLIIDDDDALSRLLELELVELGGLIIRRAPDGRAGTQLALTQPPDLILLDFEMPEMDGLDTLNWLRANADTAQTPIVAITATRQHLPRCTEMISRCNDYLPKPFSLVDLHHTIRRHLHGMAQF